MIIISNFKRGRLKPPGNKTRAMLFSIALVLLLKVEQFTLGKLLYLSLF